MNDAEFAAYWRGIEGLAAEFDQVLSDPGWEDALDAPYVYKGRKLECSGFKRCIAPYLIFAAATPPAAGAPGLAAGLYDCVCSRCKGDLRDKMCGKDKEDKK
jgi:hypothetical protein